MPRPPVVLQGVYLGTDWAKPTYAPTVSYLDNYLKYIVQSPYMDMLTQAGYGVGRGGLGADAGFQVHAGDTVMRSGHAQGRLEGAGHQVSCHLY